MFNNCNVMDYAKDEKELSLKEKIYITRIDEVDKFMDGLIVEEPIIPLNSINSMVRIEEHEGIRVTLIEVTKVS